MSFQRAFFVSAAWLMLSILTGVSHANAGEGHSRNRYVNPTLGIEFSYPKNLVVYQQGNDLFLAEPSSRPKEWRFLDRDLVSKLMSGKRAVEPESYVLHIRVRKGSFDEINMKEKAFSLQNGVMMGELGRFGLMKTKPIVASGWKGYETQVICSVFDPKTEPHAAGGDCYWAIGSNGEEGFVVDTLGNARYLKLAVQVVRTIQLKGPELKDK